MQFIRRVRAIWSWLPAFRAVAETEHLPTAAQELHVLPSSLSRTVKQLEDELAVTLFERTANTLVLNDAGRRLLAATREAMRIIDEALASASGEEMRGTVTAVAPRDLAAAVLPRACAALSNRHAELLASSLIEDERAIPEMLQRGDADVALVTSVPDSSALVCTEVATWSRGVYVRAGRTAERFVVARVAGKPTDDGWPPHVERQIAAWSSDEHAALEIVARSELATVAFDAIARASNASAQLARLATPPIASRTLYLLHRRAVGTHRRTEALVDAIREALAHFTG